jgi:tetratricopeptide (TPR) repeat protein
MSDNHNTTWEQNARHERFAAELTSAADPLVLRCGRKNTWIPAVLRMASPRMARWTMALAVLLVVVMASSEARALPPIGPPSIGPPPMGGMMGRPGFLPGPMPGGLFRPPPGPGGMPAGMSMGGPRPGLNPRGAGRPPGFRGARPYLSYRPAELAPDRSAPWVDAGRTAPIPGASGDRPGLWDRPAQERPVLGGDRADRGRVGDGDRSGWDRSYHHRHDAWYRGGWGGYWDGTWYDPQSYGASSGDSYGWPSSSASGDDGAYSNPYYDASSSDGDYSRPVKASDTDPDASAEQGYQAFDRARDAFKAGDYASALDLTDPALKDVPGDPVVHEFKALALFARGEFARAAAMLHAVLAVTPGMNWTTLSGLYPNVETYTGQLRALEARYRQDPKAAAPRLVLAYHYLVTGHKDAAVAQLQAVLALEPGDRVSRRLLASLTGTASASTESTRTVPVPDGVEAAGRPPSVDLLGRWRGERDGATFDLGLDDWSRFLWQAARQGKAAATVSGAYAFSGNTLILEPEDRSPLCASLTTLSADSFRLKNVGGAPNDAGLVFRRVAMPAASGRDQRGGPRGP